MEYAKKNGLLLSEDLHTVYGLDSIESFDGKVPYGVLSIEDEAFSGSDLLEISIPDSVTEIGSCAFENSSKLTSVKLPTEIKELPPYLFSGCTALTKVTLPNTMVSMPEGLFYGCSSLQEIPFRAGIQELPENACAGCTGIKSIVFPDSISKIGPRALADCKNLETVVLPGHLYELAPDAFEGCDNIHNIRIDGENHLFYVKEDGLYERSIDGDDTLRLPIHRQADNDIKMFDEQLDDTPNSQELMEEQDMEDDDTVSFEVGIEAEENSINDLMADILSDEKERVQESQDVSVSEQESKVLSEMMDVMSDEAERSSVGSVSTEELEKLFSSQEQQELASKESVDDAEKDYSILDSKTQILFDSAEFAKVLMYEPSGQVPEDFDLFVIAEKTVTNAQGQEDFSEKLIKCCNNIARIHNFRRVILLKGLPLDNEEFSYFYFYFINKKNVLLATQATNPSELSDYCKNICEQSRISLDKNELAEQRHHITTLNDNLIKIVLKDCYE